MAWSPSGSLDGPWVSVGRPDITVYGDTVENLEFLMIGGRWHLVATSNTLDQPWLFSLVGNPAVAVSWLHWTAGTELQIPSQAWDTGTGLSSVGYEHANSVFLCDAHAADGYYYATYAGSDELTAFGGWGHAEIGIARSRDLVHWQVPGESRSGDGLDGGGAAPEPAGQERVGGLTVPLVAALEDVVGDPVVVGAQGRRRPGAAPGNRRRPPVPGTDRRGGRSR